VVRFANDFVVQGYLRTNSQVGRDARWSVVEHQVINKVYCQTCTLNRVQLLQATARLLRTSPVASRTLLSWSFPFVRSGTSTQAFEVPMLSVSWPERADSNLIITGLQFHSLGVAES
jgi:hypothetical protein